MRFKNILFDLDGTLTDSAEGITKSVAYALKELKNMVIEPERLRPFVGPPFVDSYRKMFGFNDDEISEAIRISRIYFTSKGMYENTVYEGVHELLKTLNASGAKLHIATSKPQVFAKQILDYFELSDYFVTICGSNLDGTRTKKEEVIEHVLEQIPSYCAVDTVMIGDRHHDIEGAKAHGLTSVGVLYGYGDKKELSEAGADYIVSTPSELVALLSK